MSTKGYGHGSCIAYKMFVTRRVCLLSRFVFSREWSTLAARERSTLTATPPRTPAPEPNSKHCQLLANKNNINIINNKTMMPTKIKKRIKHKGVKATKRKRGQGHQEERKEPPPQLGNHVYQKRLPYRLVPIGSARTTDAPRSQSADGFGLVHRAPAKPA